MLGRHLVEHNGGCFSVRCVCGHRFTYRFEYQPLGRRCDTAAAVVIDLEGARSQGSVDNVIDTNPAIPVPLSGLSTSQSQYP